MATHYTYKGKSIDMGAMLMMNEHAIAIGNANLNARGDKLGNGGTIIQTAESRADAFYQQRVQQVINTDEDIATDMFASEIEIVDINLDDFVADSSDVIAPIEPVAPRRRKAPTGE